MSSPRDVLADTQRFYRKCVYRSWVHSYMSSRYLAGMIASAGIGYAPKGRTATSDHLRRLGHDPDTIIAAGVATQTGHGLHDVMRDRLIFPIHDHTGELVAFLGRAAPNTDTKAPKYLNTPATELYDKSATLYGLGERFDALRTGAAPLIVEGPMDKLATDRAVAESGADVVALASCGTSLSHEHLARIASVTDAPIWFCFDSDRAGHNALLRAWELTQNTKRLRHMVVRLPAGHDPASVHPRTLNAAIAAATPMSIAIAETQLTIWGHPNNPVHAALMVSKLANRDAARIAPTDAGAWIATVSKRTTVPLTDVQTSLLDATSTPHTACFPTTPSAFASPNTAKDRGRKKLRQIGKHQVAAALDGSPL